MDVKTIMDSWTLQTGYPVVTVIRNYDSSTANLTQSRKGFNARFYTVLVAIWI